MRGSGLNGLEVPCQFRKVPLKLSNSAGLGFTAVVRVLVAVLSLDIF